MTFYSIFPERAPGLWDRPSRIGWPNLPKFSNMLNFSHIENNENSLTFSVSLWFPTSADTEFDVLHDLLAGMENMEPIGFTWTSRWDLNTKGDPKLMAATNIGNMSEFTVPDQQLASIIQVIEILKGRWLELCRHSEEHLQNWVSALRALVNIRKSQYITISVKRS